MGGWSKFFLGAGIAFAFLLLLGVVVAFAAIETATPVMEHEYRTQLLRDEQTCTTPCSQLALAKTFSPPAGAHAVEARLGIIMFAGGGALRVQVMDPSGDIVLDRTVAASSQAQSVDEAVSWAPEQGEWRYTVSTTAFQGVLGFDAAARGVPPGSLD